MKKIKVVMLAPYLLGPKNDGAAMYTNKLIYYISHRDDIELHIITLDSKNRRVKKDKTYIHILNGVLPRPLPLLIHIKILKREILKIKPDIVHAIGSAAPYSTVATVIRNKYPTVVTAFGVVAKEFKFYRGIVFIFGILIHKQNEKYVLSKIPNIIVQTPSIKNLISKWTKSKIYIAPSGIEYNEIETIQSHCLLNKKPDIFFVNNLTKIKGIDILIKAVPNVLKSIPNLSVCIAGTGPKEKELKALVRKLHLDKHVKFLGFISEEEKYQYYKACKLVVVPSRWDCQPFAPLDGAASGKPVVASRVGGVRDTVDDGETGFLFESENIEDLADKIVTLLKDEKLMEEMGRAAKEKAKSYDWKKIAERTAEIYKEVIADFHGQKAKDKRTRKKL